MLMNRKVIHFEIMKNDTLDFNDESNRKAVLRCDLADCSVRVVYLCTSNTAI